MTSTTVIARTPQRSVSSTTGSFCTARVPAYLGRGVGGAHAVVCRGNYDSGGDI